MLIIQSNVNYFQSIPQRYMSPFFYPGLYYPRYFRQYDQFLALPLNPFQSALAILVSAFCRKLFSPLINNFCFLDRLPIKTQVSLIFSSTLSHLQSFSMPTTVIVAKFLFFKLPLPSFLGLKRLVMLTVIFSLPLETLRRMSTNFPVIADEMGGKRKYPDYIYTI